MITNINYLKTAVEVLAENSQDPEITIKILKTVSQICQQNIERIQERIDLGECDESA